MNPKEATFRVLAVKWILTSVAIFMGISGTESARAFTASDVALAYQCWNDNFYFTLNNGTQGYYRNEQGSGTTTSFWQMAEQIETAEDANDINRVNLLCAGFIANNGTDWSGNTYNDDLEWAAIAFVRAYQMTGNANYLTYAENGLNLAYSRGWDTAGGGGIWQNTADANGPGKLSCANGPACIAAYLIYQSTSNSSYLTMAQTINSWQKANNYNPITGEVYESNTSTNTCYSYDSGTFAASCWYLGDTNTPIQCGNFVETNWGVQMQHFGTGADAGGFNGICLRWLGKVGYNPGFLRAVVDNAWAYRNAEGLVSDYWYAPTSDTNTLYSWDCGSIVAAMFAVTPTQSGLVSGQFYQLEPQNAVGKRLDVRNGDFANGTQVQIFTYNNTLAQKWRLIAVDIPNNIYSLEPQNAQGMCLGVLGGASTNGTPVQIFTASNSTAQNWKFYVIDPTNGIYALQPQNAMGMCLDVQGGLSADSTPVQIYTSNNTAAQKWRLYPYPAPANPTFQGMVPNGGSIDIPVATPISVQMVIGGLPITNILLKVDGGSVTPSMSTNSGVITVDYQPSPALSAGALHMAQIIVNDSSGSIFTNTWSFTTAFQSLPSVLPGPIVASNQEVGIVIFSTNDAWVGTNYGPASSKIIYARFSMEFDNLNGETGSGGGYGGLHFFEGGTNGTPHLIAGNAWISTNWSADPYPPLPQTDLNPVTPIVFHQWHTIVERVNYTPGANAAVKVWLDPNFNLTEAAQPNAPITFSMNDSFDTIMLRTGNGTTSATFSNIVMAATSGDIGFAVVPAVMSIANAGGSMSLSWTSTGTLQTAPAVIGPWTDVSNQANPQVLNTTNPMTFYRLRQ